MSETNPFEPMSDAPDQDAPEPQDFDYRPEADEKPSNDDGVPVGSAREVLDWVGDDKDRAKQALDAENDKPESERRKGVLKSLNSILS